MGSPTLACYTKGRFPVKNKGVDQARQHASVASLLYQTRYGSSRQPDRTLACYTNIQIAPVIQGGGQVIKEWRLSSSSRAYR